MCIRDSLRRAHNEILRLAQRQAGHVLDLLDDLELLRFLEAGQLDVKLGLFLSGGSAGSGGAGSGGHGDGSGGDAELFLHCFDEVCKLKYGQGFYQIKDLLCLFISHCCCLLYTSSCV